ncbi:MAG: hypothetical protein KDK71_04735 [Chlamydiia bacterium]|nr:hypothetical protein [Chlamydiia bacterium]
MTLTFNEVSISYLDTSISDYFTKEFSLSIDNTNVKSTYKLEALNTSKWFSTLIGFISVLFGHAVIANISDDKGTSHTYVVKKSSFNTYFFDSLQAKATINDPFYFYRSVVLTLKDDQPGGLGV